MAKRETDFQRDLRKEILERFPGSIVTKIEPIHYQGIPDLLVLHNNKWAMLECKRSVDEIERSRRKPGKNQEYYISKLNEMSFASFVAPENKEEVLNDLEQTFKA